MQNNPHRRNASSALSEREAQVLQMLAHGIGVDQIAEQLQIMPATVRNHIANMMGKLGAHSQLEAVITGFRRGLVSLPSFTPKG